MNRRRQESGPGKSNYNIQITLVIHAEQLPILNESFLAAFCEQAAVYIQSAYPAQFGGVRSQGVRCPIELGILKASKYGIELQAHVCNLLAVRAEFGVDVDQRAWASAILRDPPESANVRIGLLTGWGESPRQVWGKE